MDNQHSASPSGQRDAYAALADQLEALARRPLHPRRDVLRFLARRLRALAEVSR